MNPEVNYITPTTEEALAYYEETYYLYKDEQFDEVKSRTQTAIEKYPTEIIIAKFALLNALAIGKTESRENFINALELITVAYQNTEEAAKAQEILDLLNGVKREKAEEKKTVGDEKSKEQQKKEAEAKRKQDTQGPGQRSQNTQQRDVNKREAQKPNPDTGSRRQGPGRPGD